MLSYTLCFFSKYSVKFGGDLAANHCFLRKGSGKSNLHLCGIKIFAEVQPASMWASMRQQSLANRHQKHLLKVRCDNPHLLTAA